MSGMPKSKPLPRAFYERGAEEVAPLLLGQWLVRRTPTGPAGGLIVEVEAYLHDDPACHAFRGATARNRSMFGSPGYSYVYFIYGMHHCVNAVCRPSGIGEAVLLRAIEPTFGLEWMRARRSGQSACLWTNGPAKLCKALDIDRRLDGVDLCNVRSSLWIAQNPEAWRIRSMQGVERGPRIGITQAALLPLRFHLIAHPNVSRRRKPRQRA